MTLRTVLPRLVLGLVIAGAAVWLALNRDRVDPALIETSIRDLGIPCFTVPGSGLDKTQGRRKA